VLVWRRVTCGLYRGGVRQSEWLCLGVLEGRGGGGWDGWGGGETEREQQEDKKSYESCAVEYLIMIGLFAGWGVDGGCGCGWRGGGGGGMRVGAEIARCPAKRKMLLFDAMRHELIGLRVLLNSLRVENARHMPCK